MVVTLVALWAFMLGGMKRELVPGRWQVAVEGFTGFIDDMLTSNIGPAGKRFVPYVFSLFMFILFANILGLLPLGDRARRAPVHFTSHLTVTGVLAIISFAIVLIVGFGKHGFHFFSLFVPHGTPVLMIPLIFVVELMCFLVRPFRLGLRLFVAMTAGHILLKVLAAFVINGLNLGARLRPAGVAAQLRADDRHHAARAAGRRDPGLCLRAADVASTSTTRSTCTESASRTLNLPKLNLTGVL